MEKTIINFQKKSKKNSKKDDNNNHTDHVCDICGFKTISQVKLRKHKVNVHDDRQYTCEVCGKTVTGRKTMNNHSIIFIPK